MDPIEAAIFKTVVYADLFNFPLTAREIHHFLIHDKPVSEEQVLYTLQYSNALPPVLTVVDGYVVYNGREELIALRKAREAASERLWPQAIRCGAWLARLPFVRMVAITGALAMHNAADDDDDLDYILVKSHKRVWIARAFAIVVVRLGRRFGVEICPNYVLAESALEQDKHDIFMAHEVAQMVPVYWLELYNQFRAANGWVGDHLSNAKGVYFQEPEYAPAGVWKIFKQTIEGVLGGELGDWFENWEYRRKLRRFAQDMRNPHSSARLDKEHVKGHFNDHGHPILERYYQRLRESHIDEITETALTGD
jgi:hypothetical protein